jgi:signal transduction histidine kinase
MERARASVFLGLDVADPHRPVEGSWLRRLQARFTSGATWREIAYHLLLLPTGVVGSTLVVTAWAGSLVLLALPVAIRAMPDRTAHFYFFDLSGPAVWLGPVAGVLAILLCPWIARGWSLIDASMVRTLLGPSSTADLVARVDTLTASRALAVDAAEEERRRIERNLHDGAQQRLVALAMDLGMARAKFDSDPDAARALLDDAHGEAKQAIVELRDLARGIHPVALTDRGLPGAIPGLAARVPVPVDVRVDVDERPAPAIEGIAYFVVAEALTNIAKHSGASQAAIVIERERDRLRVEVTDNGRGGAAVVAGSGLRGLSDRVAAVDGLFVVDSPTGGPTSLQVELPCRVGER